MDSDDVKHLEGLIIDLKGSLETKIASLDGRVTDVKGNLERLIVDVKDSLEREMHTGFSDVRNEIAELRTDVKTRFDTQAARLERQGSLLQVGSRWTTRMNGWAEKVDAALEQKDHEIADLRDRIKRLEDKL